MTDETMAAWLTRTYPHTLRAFRPLSGGREAALTQDASCALSRSAHTSAPTPPQRSYVLPEALYRLTLYTRPEDVLALGDRVEITDEDGRVWHGRTSDSFRYPSHCVTVVEISEVAGKEET